MIAYLDSSALVKCYVAEVESEATVAWVAQAEESVSSVISEAEVAAALATAMRAGRMSRAAAQQAQLRFDQEWARMPRIPVQPGLVARAARLAWVRVLRGYDSVQLATALQLRESVAVPVVLATFDQQLRAAALSEGLAAWPA